MHSSFDSLRQTIEARTGGRPDRCIKVKGPWLSLTGGELADLIQPLWAAQVNAPVVPIARGADWFIPGHDRRRSDLAWAAGDAALLTWWNWVGGTPGDACQTHLAMLFPNGLIQTDTVDSCWMPVLVFDVWGDPPDGLLEACVSAIKARPGTLPKP